MNRYVGNSGVVERIPEPGPGGGADHPQKEEWTGGDIKKPSSHSGIISGLGGLLSKAIKAVPETEDLILIAVLYLMFRESGDIEFLLIAGIMLFL